MTDRLGVGTFVYNEEEQTSSNLDVFHVPNVDTTLREGKTIYYYPTNAVENSGPFEFIIPRDPDSFTNLPYTRLEGCIELTKDDGSALTTAEKFYPVNLFTQSIFKQVECELNGIQVCDLSTPTYAYKSFIETHLSYGDEAKSTHLKCALYEKDTIGKEELLDDSNVGAVARFNAIKSKKIYFSNIIHSDFFQSQKYLIPNVEIKLKFIRNADDFSVMTLAATKYKINIKALKLSVRKVRISPEVHMSIERTLKSVPAHYDLTQSKIKTFLIPTGTKSIDFPAIIQGNLPRSVIFGLVAHDGFNGIKTGNPFLFNNQKVNSFNLKINGVPVVPSPFQPDFAAGDYMREYRWFYDNCGISHENDSNGITKEEFAANSTFWTFDLTACLCNSFHIHETKKGSMDLSLSFSDVTTKNLHVLVYGSFNSAIAIDGDRNVKVIE
jgi:hypothetical protein